MELHVAYSTDNNYVIHTGVSMLTLFKNNREFNDIVVHILDNGISNDNKNKLTEIAKQFNRKICFYRVNISKLIGSKINNSVKQISISSYGRLFLASVLKNIEKVIYMDSDSVITGSFYVLWNLDISNYSIAGVLDNCNEKAKIKIGLDLNDIYINAGFLLMNLQKIRKISAEKKMVNFIKKNNGDVYHHDQGVINAIFKGDILILHPKYNVMTPFFDMNVQKIKRLYKTSPYYSQKQIDEAKSNPIFVHFTPSFSKRPWIKGCKHPLRHIYLDNLKQTPWKSIKLQKDNRKLRIRILENIYNYFPFWVYESLFKLINKISDK